MKKILFFLSLAFFVLSGCTKKTDLPVEKTSFLLDTVATITIYSCENPKEASQIIDDAFKLCTEYENMLSHTIETSDVYKINNSKGNSVKVSEETAGLISSSIEYSKLSEGRFDVTIAQLSTLWDFKGENPTPPSNTEILSALFHVGYNKINIDGETIALNDENASIDLGAIAKGYIADKTGQFLRDKGVTSAIINLGGNILTIGKNSNGKNFNIGIQKPFETTNEILGSVSVENKSIVTSGIYQRFFKYEDKLYHHILDPKTGYPVENNLNSITIISEKSIEGDALSTTCFVLGEEKGLELINKTSNVEAIFVTKDNKVLLSDGIGTEVEFKPYSK